MAGRDKSVGWCQVETHSNVYYLPRAEFEPLTAKLRDRRGGWMFVEDVFGASRAFKMSSILDVSDWSPDAIALCDDALAEDRLTDPGE